MDEMTKLSAFRDEVPLAPPSPAARQLFHAGLREESIERTGLTAPRRRLLPAGRTRWWQLAVPGVLALGLAALLVALFLPPDSETPAGQPETASTANLSASGSVISAKLLADTAAEAVRSQRPVSPGQWVYQKVEVYSDRPTVNQKTGQVQLSKTASIQADWVTADGGDEVQGTVTGRPLIGGVETTGPDGAAGRQALADAAKAYKNLGSLPKDPAALEYYFEHHEEPAGATPTERASDAYRAIQDMLSTEILPPALTAELYHALADVPGVIAKEDVKDVVGQRAVEFILPQTVVSVNLGTFLSAEDYQYLGQASWASQPWTFKKLKGGGYEGTGGIVETVLLDQAYVSGPLKLP